MKLHLRRLCFFLSLVLAVSGLARGQTPSDMLPGLVPYQSFHGGDIDQINLSNGKPVIRIPLISYPQRGSLKLNFDILIEGAGSEGELCVPHGRCIILWANAPPAGIEDEQSLGITWSTVTCGSTCWYYTFATISADGSEHPMPYACQGTATLETDDATGMQSDAGCRTNPTYVRDRDGVWNNAVSTTPLREDANGNIISYTSPDYTDSLGRVIPGVNTWTTDFSGCPASTGNAQIWAPPGPNGGTSQFKFCYAGKEAIGLLAVVLPNGTSWQFAWNGPHGEISQITFPTGGTLSYTWTPFKTFSALIYSDWVASRTVNANDGTGPHTWTYTWGSYCTTCSPETGTNIVTDPMGNDTVHTMTAFGGGASPEPFETLTQYYQGSHTTGTLIKTVETDYNSNWGMNGYIGPSAINIFPIRTITTWAASGKVTKVEKDYDSAYEDGGANLGFSYGDVVAVREYDYGVGAPGPLLRQTKTAYMALGGPNSANYLANNLLTLPYTVQVFDGGNTVHASTTYNYDQYTLAASGVSSSYHDQNPPDGAYRGNLTSVQRWLSGSTVQTTNCRISVSNRLLTSYKMYNDTGTIATSVDSCGTSYADASHLTSYSYSLTYQGAYPTTITNPLGQTTTNAFDFDTGLLTSTTDPNQQTTSFTYDSMWRPSSISYPDGGLTTITRQESTFPFSATLTKEINSSQSYSTTNVFDGFGRVSQNQVADPQGTIYTDTTYDADGRAYSVSNPYRTKSDPTYGVTTYQYDALNRTTLVTQPDGNTVQTSYCSPTTLVTDEARHWRRSTTDGLGRLIEVDEPNSTSATVSACPAGGDPIWATTYGYDTLDDLASVVQGNSRYRSFVYDSLKHLTSSSNPEAGNVTYGYDADGNVITKTDARNIAATYSYDTLNRAIGISYSNGDPTVSYAYDQTSCIGQSPCYNVGRRTSMTDAGGSEILSYDKMGREWGEKRTTNNVPETTTYTYDLAGDLATLTYPSGRTITYTYDSAQRPSEAQDIANGINYVTGSCQNGVNSSGVCYAPQEALASFSLGVTTTFTGIAVSDSYNTRLQPNQLSATSPAGTAMNLTYSFVDVNGHNNGNVIAITNNKTSARSQSFSYDQVNRILSGQTTATSGSTCWGETFSYDQWANLTSVGALSGYSTCVQNGLSVTVGTNNQLSSTGFSYDAAGNMLGDGANTYAWNAESETKSANGVNYAYDGDGNRVEKSSGKLYWYGAGTEVLDESNLSGTITDEYVFFGAKRVAHVAMSSGNVYYYIEDFLGSSRVMTDSSGNVCYDADFDPYGAEYDVTNTCGQNYKFEGKERDAETGNDDFGARYYRSVLGRWLSADWSGVPEAVPYANLTNPQTLNLYAMVSDNPETFADLDGHILPAPEDGMTASPANPCSNGNSSQCAGAAQNSTAQPTPPPAQPQQPNQAQSRAAQLSQDEQNKVVALVCAESCTTSKDEQKAVASAIINRANSNDKQYVASGQEVNVTNVVESGQFQAYSTEKSSTYQQALSGNLDKQSSYQSARDAVADVLKNGVTTNATFIYYGNSPPSSGWMGKAVQNGTLVSATPASVGDWYLYVPK